MARIAGVDLPMNKRVEVALTYIFGIGPDSVPAGSWAPRASTRHAGSRT